MSTAFKLPTEPYPGLRPFLDHEAALLLGRGRQVREVIARLRETRFVAVIGGSGSGKSSLIRAGVVPDLRGFGIPDAGDYWIPVVCTPGTTVATPPQSTTALLSQTPVTRLAWKFSQLLEPADAVLKKRVAAGLAETPAEPAVDLDGLAAQRRADIALVFGQGGFARLIDAYFDELPALGPARENACFLFVIDQFEELFHPNNRDNPDARVLVEAVIDHFFNPHPRCYVILTMRSEHLADCAGYLELPDAINKSSYLVRRLDNTELREAIVGPAKYFLRLCQRAGAAPGRTLPDDIRFDEPVIKRLLADVSRISDDADHLPLLQHVLARTWEAACAREGVDGAVSLPAQMVWADLENAVDPRTKREPGWLHSQPVLNTLRSSLENWAEAVFRDRPVEQRHLIDAVLRQLAFKDPNNGLYSQQRLDVDDPSLLKGISQPRQTLRDLLEVGFLDTVNYLFWDKENPDRVTVKVSHESFIRGWAHFRALVDAEAERFEEFVAVLRKCVLWKVEEKPELLLEASELLRADSAGLRPVFENRDERAGWFRVLLQFRDGDRLSKAEPVVDRFLAESRAGHEAEQAAQREAAERERDLQALASQAEAEAARAEAESRRNFWLGVTAFIVAFVLLPYAAFAIFVQAPVLQTVEKFAAARALVERRERSESNPVVGSAGRELGTLLRAAELVKEAQANVAFFDLRPVRTLVEWLPPVADAKRLAGSLTSEPVVNGSLRGLLTSALWFSTTDPGQLKTGALIKPDRREVVCSVTPPLGETEPIQGSLFLDQDAKRGVFVPSLSGSDPEIGLYAASLRGGDCVAGRIVWSVPRYLQPLLLFDARVRYMAVALQGPSAGQPSVQIYTIAWERGDEQRLPGATVRFRSVLADQRAVARVQTEVDPANTFGVNVTEVKGVPAWREVGGIGVSVAGSSWLLFSDSAQRIESPGPVADWAVLGAPPRDSGCDSLARSLGRRVQPGFNSTMFEHGGHCFEIRRGNPVPRPSAAVAPETSVAPDAPRQQVLIAVYDAPRPQSLAAADAPLPTPVATLVAFDRLAPGPADWLVGRSGPYEGWIALRRQRNGIETYSGAPWSTSALIRMGQQVHALSAAAAALAASAPAPSAPALPVQARRPRAASVPAASR